MFIQFAKGEVYKCRISRYRFPFEACLPRARRTTTAIRLDAFVATLSQPREIWLNQWGWRVGIWKDAFILQVIIFSTQASLGLSIPRQDHLRRRQTQPRQVWDTVLRLEDAIGYRINPELESVMLKNVRRLFDNPDHICFHLPQIASMVEPVVELHSLREGLLSLWSLVRFRNNR